MNKASYKNSSVQIRRYYHEFGSLFRIMTDDSAILNIGFVEKDKRLRCPGKMQEHLIQMVVNTGGLKKGMRVLDVGCGLGGPAMFLEKVTGCRVVGIDPVVSNVRQAKQRFEEPSRNPTVRFLSGDAMALPFTQGSFDFVYSIESAFHYQDKALFLKESARVLKKNGRLAVADILKAPKRKESGLFRLVKKAVSASHFYDMAAYRSACSSAGMKMILEKDITRGVLRTFPVWRKKLASKWKSLASHYPFRTLAVVGLGFWILPLVVKFLSFRYSIIVFQVSENRSG